MNSKNQYTSAFMATFKDANEASRAMSKRYKIYFTAIKHPTTGLWAVTNKFSPKIAG